MVSRGWQPGERKQTHRFSLDQVPIPSRVRVLEVVGGRGTRQMLAQLHIRVGGLLHVHRTAPLGGPVLVESEGSKVAVGRGLAHKVVVRVLP